MTERANPAIIIVSHDNAAFLVDEFGRYARDYDIRPATSARIASDISTEIEATGGQVAMYVARELTNHSFTEIGRGIGNRDHTTAMNAVKRVKASLLIDSATRSSVENVLTRLGRPA